MQFVPICLECDNFKKGDICKVYGTPRFDVKNREKNCQYFTGGKYTLYTKEAYPGANNYENKLHG